MRVLFLCDGNPDVGLGHVSRCLGLAEALRRRGLECEFRGELDGSARQMLASASFASANGSEIDRADAVVVDSYDITAADLQSIKAARPWQALTIVDDFALLPHYPPSLIVNFTVRAPELEYAGDALRVLRGPPYFLVREAVRELYGRQPVSPPHNVLVSIGGFDQHKLGPTVAAILARAGYAVDVVSGPSRPHLANEYARADACVTSGGLTKYEGAYVGLPVAAVSQTPGEAEDTSRFAAMDLCADLGLGVEAAELGERILGFLADDSQQARMRAACLATFRQDSTDAVAAEVERSIPARL